MKKKTRVILTTVIGLLLLMAVAAAGLNAVFTVTLVSTQFSLITEAGSEDAAALKEKLDGYVGKNTTFLSLKKLENDVAEYPCFRLDSVKKKYPSTVEVKISERRERFALCEEDIYFIVDEDGYCMDMRAQNTNRAGGDNILLEGFSLQASVGSPLSGEHLEELLAIFEVFDAHLGDPRANISSVTCKVSASPEPGRFSSVFSVQMREGVRIEIDEPEEHPAQKAYAALFDEAGGYFTLDERGKSGGSISVVSVGEEIIVNYNFSRG